MSSENYALEYKDESCAGDVNIKWDYYNLSRNTFKNGDNALKKKMCADIITNGCENWLFKPVCNDNTVGIATRLSFNKIKDLQFNSSI